MNTKDIPFFAPQYHQNLWLTVRIPGGGDFIQIWKKENPHVPIAAIDKECRAILVFTGSTALTEGGVVDDTFIDAPDHWKHIFRGASLKELKEAWNLD